jgi:hypothetical protein
MLRPCTMWAWELLRCASSAPAPLQAVTRSEGEALGRDYGMSFFETSAKKDIGVSEAFQCIAKLVVDRLVKDGRGPAGGGGGAAGGGAKAAEKTTVALEGKEKKGGCCK